MRITLQNGTSVTPYKMKNSNDYFLKCGKYYIVNFDILSMNPTINHKLDTFDFNKDDIELLKVDDYRFIQSFQGIKDYSFLVVTIPDQWSNNHDTTTGIMHAIYSKVSNILNYDHEYNIEIDSTTSSKVHKSNVVSIKDRNGTLNFDPYHVSSGFGKTIVLLNTQVIYIGQLFWLLMNSLKDNNDQLPQSVIQYENYLPTSMFMTMTEKFLEWKQKHDRQR